MLLRSKTKLHLFSIRGRFDQKSFLMRGLIVPPSKLIITNILPSKGGFLIRGGFLLGVEITDNNILIGPPRGPSPAPVTPRAAAQARLMMCISTGGFMSQVARGGIPEHLHFSKNSSTSWSLLVARGCRP